MAPDCAHAHRNPVSAHERVAVQPGSQGSRLLARLHTPKMMAVQVELRSRKGTMGLHEPGEGGQINGVERRSGGGDASEPDRPRFHQARNPLFQAHLDEKGAEASAKDEDMPHAVPISEETCKLWEDEHCKRDGGMGSSAEASPFM